MTTDSTLTNSQRQRAIELADHTCERCGWVAWSRTRADQLQVRRRKDGDALPRVLCPDCAARYDARHTTRRAVAATNDPRRPVTSHHT